MIHRRKGRKLKRTASHRKSLLANLSVSLIKNKKIRTTLAKAKELRTYIEPIITRSKKAYLAKDAKPEASVHARREVNRFLNDREAVTTLFNEIAPKVVDRNGGYTRVLKMGRRLGDSAEMALIELVDYNLEQSKTDTASTDADSNKEVKSKGASKKTKKGATEKAETKTSAKKSTVKKKTETKKSSDSKKTAKSSKKKEAAE